MNSSFACRCTANLTCVRFCSVSEKLRIFIEYLLNIIVAEHKVHVVLPFCFKKTFASFNSENVTAPTFIGTTAIIMISTKTTDKIPLKIFLLLFFIFLILWYNTTVSLFYLRSLLPIRSYSAFVKGDNLA